MAVPETHSTPGQRLAGLRPLPAGTSGQPQSWPGTQQQAAAAVEPSWLKLGHAVKRVIQQGHSTSQRALPRYPQLQQNPVPPVRRPCRAALPPPEWPHPFSQQCQVFL